MLSLPSLRHAGLLSVLLVSTLAGTALVSLPVCGQDGSSGTAQISQADLPGKADAGGSTPAYGQAPLVVPPISFFDINTGRFGKLEIDLEDAQFVRGAVKHMHVSARSFDLSSGHLDALQIELEDAQFKDFTADRLSLRTSGSLEFVPGSLLNNKVLEFRKPAEAEVYAEVSQQALNRFLSSPQTLKRLSVTAMKQAGIIGNLIGQAIDLAVAVENGRVILRKKNSVDIMLTVKIGTGQLGVPIPLQLSTKLSLEDGWLHLSETKLLSSGQEISPDISQLIVNKVNGLSNWGQRNEDMRFRFTSLKVHPGKKFVLTGSAEIVRLRFGRDGD